MKFFVIVRTSMRRGGNGSGGGGGCHLAVDITGVVTELRFRVIVGVARARHVVPDTVGTHVIPLAVLYISEQPDVVGTCRCFTIMITIDRLKLIITRNGYMRI
jgi:hypothetical protein